jgi:hypothetical protein
VLVQQHTLSVHAYGAALCFIPFAGPSAPELFGSTLLLETKHMNIKAPLLLLPLCKLATATSTCLLQWLELLAWFLPAAAVL